MARTWFWAKLSQKRKVEADVVESSEVDEETEESNWEITPTEGAEEESDAERLLLLDELAEKVETTEDEKVVLLIIEENAKEAKAEDRLV